MTAPALPFAEPQDACDSHIHINDPHFAYLPAAELKPPPATVGDYRLVQERLGTHRVVVVQPSSYGTDNRCTLDAVSQLGVETARAVVVVSADVSLAALQGLHAQGACGVRVNLARGASFGGEAIETLAARIGTFGWHLQLHAQADTIVLLEPVLRRLPVPVVLDHMARIAPETGIAHPAYATVRRLLDDGGTWVKLSGAYLDSRTGAPAYADRGAVARALIAAAPERMVWGSDWPHPSASAGERAVPDPSQLLAVLADWAPDAVLRQRILVDNPQALYGFAPIAASDTDTPQASSIFSSV